MEHGGEGRQGVGARLHYFAHHVNLDGAGIAQGQADFKGPVGSVQSAVGLAQHTLQVFIGFAHGHAAQVDRTDFFDIDGAVGRNLLTDGVLAGSPDVDNHFVARTETVVGRGGEVDAGFESKVAGIEDVASEHLIFLCQFAAIRLRIFQYGGGAFFLSGFAQAGLVLFGAAHFGSADSLFLFVQLLDTFGLFAGHATASQLGGHLALVLTFGHALFYIL